MYNDLILVTGGTGKTGRRVAENLQNRRFGIRTVSRKSTLPFDWNDTTTWDDALLGVSAVYIVHPQLGSIEAAEQIRDFAHTAAMVGVKKAVLVATPEDDTNFSQVVRSTEQHIINAGLSLTSLRLRWFFQNFSEDFLFQPVLSGALRLPAGTGKEAFIDADDIAEVAAIALTDNHHNGKFYDLTGPQLLSFGDIADEIKRSTGHDVKYESIDSETFVAEQLAQGMPVDFAYMLNALYQDISNHKSETISHDVETVLGRPARNFADFVSNMANEGIWTEGHSI